MLGTVDGLHTPHNQYQLTSQSLLLMLRARGLKPSHVLTMYQSPGNSLAIKLGCYDFFPPYLSWNAQQGVPQTCCSASKHLIQGANNKEHDGYQPHILRHSPPYTAGMAMQPICACQPHTPSANALHKRPLLADNPADKVPQSRYLPFIVRR